MMQFPLNDGDFSIQLWSENVNDRKVTLNIAGAAKYTASTHSLSPRVAASHNLLRCDIQVYMTKFYEIPQYLTQREDYGR